MKGTLVARIFLLLALITIIACVPSHPSPEPDCPAVIIRPVLHVNREISDDDDIATMLNSISAQCPNGMNAVDSEHLFRDRMTYAEAFNAVARVTCEPHKQTRDVPTQRKK